MRRGLIVGGALAVLCAAVLWWWSAQPHEAVVLAQTERGTPAPSAVAASQGGAWALLAEATRQADADDARGNQFCGAPFMDERPEPTEAMADRLEQQAKAAVAAQSRRLAAAPDDLGQLTAAVLANDLARIAQIGQTTEDPVVYGIALRSCRNPDTLALYHQNVWRTGTGGPPVVQAVPACAGLTAERWTQLAPENAVAWWARAAEAPTPEAARQAMTSAKAARQVVHNRGKMLARIVADGPRDPAALLPVWLPISHIDISEPAMSVAGLRRACGATTLVKEASPEVCRDLALDVLDKETGVGALSRVADLAVEVYGLPADQLPYSAQERGQMGDDLGALRAPRTYDLRGFGCALATHFVEFDLERAQLGELGVLKRNGKLPPRRARTIASSPNS